MYVCIFHTATRYILGCHRDPNSRPSYKSRLVSFYFCYLFLTGWNAAIFLFSTRASIVYLIFRLVTLLVFLLAALEVLPVL